MSKFPERLKKLRQQRGVNQTDLSKFLHYGSSAIANYENGRNEPSYDVLINIADYFGVSTDYLLGKDNQPVSYQKIEFDEAELLENYRKMNKDLQTNVRNMVSAIVNNRK